MNNNKIAKFSKVSYEQFEKDYMKLYPLTEDESKDNFVVDIYKEAIKKSYENIKLPKRSTHGSAGYDLFLPYTIEINAGESVVIPTGIHCEVEDGWVLEIYPRSGHGFKYGIHLANTVGIIDSDYFYADNEGHIMIKLVNDSILSCLNSTSFGIGTAFCQGIFIPYGITVDDTTDSERKGGFGSTDSKNS